MSSSGDSRGSGESRAPVIEAVSTQLVDNVARVHSGTAGSEGDGPVQGPKSPPPSGPSFPAYPAGAGGPGGSPPGGSPGSCSAPSGGSAASPRWTHPARAGYLGPPVPREDDDGSTRSTRANGGIWLVIAVVGFLFGQVLSAALLYVGAAASGNLSDVAQLASRSVPPAWVVVCGLVGLWIGFLGAVVVASRVGGTGSVRRDMRLDVRPWDVVVGAAVGLAFQLLVLRLLYLPLEQFIPRLSERLSQPAKHLTGGFPGADLAVIAVLTVVVVPVVEEMFFRGLVLRGFLRVFSGAGRLLGPALACCATGVVFGLAHFELLGLLGLAAFGVVLSWMAYKFRRLGPCIFAHGVFNLVAILVVAYPTGVIHLVRP